MTVQSGDVRALLEQIAKALVDEPDQVSVNHLDGDVLELSVVADAVSKVIGAKGRVARALRALIGAAGLRMHKRFTLEILE